MRGENSYTYKKWETRKQPEVGKSGEKVRWGACYRCHKNYIINYKYAFALRTGNIMLMRLEAVPYDKNKRKGFLKGLAKYMGNVAFVEDM